MMLLESAEINMELRIKMYRYTFPKYIDTVKRNQQDKQKSQNNNSIDHTYSLY